MNLASPKRRNLGMVLLSLGVLLSCLSYSWAEQALRVGVYDFDPMISTPIDGKPRGLFIDILEYVARKEGWRIEYVPGTWDECLHRVQSGKIDLLPSIGYSEERTAILDFTNEYLFLDWGVIYRRKDSPIRSILDLGGKRIGALQGSIYTEGFRNLLNRFDLKAHIVEKDNYRQICKAIEDGTVDVGINAQAYGLLLEHDYRIEATDILFSPVKIGFAAPKNRDKKILQALDTYISELKADPYSYYYERFRHWTGLYAKKEVFPLWLKDVLSIVTILLVVAITFAVILKRQVAARTSELSTAHEALKASEAEYRRIVETASEGIWSMDENFVTTFVNEHMAKMLGYDRSEMIGRSVKRFMLEEDLVDHQEKTEDRQKGLGGTHERRFRHKDGSAVWTIVSATTKVDDDGRFKGSLAMFTDITERKQAEELLRQSEASVRNRLKAIAEPDGDIGALELSDIIDIEELQSLMEDFYRLTGMLGALLDVSGRVLVAVGWQDICTKFHRCHPDTLKNCIESDTVLTHGVPPGTFKAYRCKNNLWDMVTPLFVGGKHVGNVFIGQFFYDWETPDVEAFREQARRHGFDETEYLAALDRVPRFSREKVDAGMQFYAKVARIISTLSLSTIQQSRMLAERKRAVEVILRLNAELEQRVLERTAELEAANKELESFSYSVSHDLRAPLRAISGFAQILATDYPAQLDDRGRHYLNNIVDASAHMDRLIVDLLAYSRIGRRSVGHEAIALKGLLAQIARTMADQFAAVNASLTIQDNIPEVIGDETLLSQIFTNLIVNALTYRRSEEPLRVDVTCHVEGPVAAIRVSDNGIGIRPEYLEKIFNIFQRLHNQDAYPGTGIGLATVKKSVALLGGEVSVESVPGQGSTFSVKLPLAK